METRLRVWESRLQAVSAGRLPKPGLRTKKPNRQTAATIRFNMETRNQKVGRQRVNATLACGQYD